MKSWFVIDGRLPTIDFQGNTDIRYPEALVERMLERYSRPGDSVLDPFCGFGTTLKVCARMGRRAVGFERDDNIYRYALADLPADGRLYHDAAENIGAYALPQFDLLLSSPPFRSFRDPASLDFDGYYVDLVRVFGALREHLKPDARVIVETVNLAAPDDRSVPRAFRSAIALAELFAFEREYICCNSADAQVTEGSDHSYLLVFRNAPPTQPAPA